MMKIRKVNIKSAIKPVFCINLWTEEFSLSRSESPIGTLAEEEALHEEHEKNKNQRTFKNLRSFLPIKGAKWLISWESSTHNGFWLVLVSESSIIRAEKMKCGKDHDEIIMNCYVSTSLISLLLFVLKIVEWFIDMLS